MRFTTNNLFHFLNACAINNRFEAHPEPLEQLSMVNHGLKIVEKHATHQTQQRQKRNKKGIKKNPSKVRSKPNLYYVHMDPCARMLVLFADRGITTFLFSLLSMSTSSLSLSLSFFFFFLFLFFKACTTWSATHGSGQQTSLKVRRRRNSTSFEVAHISTPWMARKTMRHESPQGLFIFVQRFRVFFYILFFIFFLWKPPRVNLTRVQ